MDDEEEVRAWRMLVAFCLGVASLFLAFFAVEQSLLDMSILLVFAVVMFLYGIVLWRRWTKAR